MINKRFFFQWWSDAETGWEKLLEVFFRKAKYNY